MNRVFVDMDGVLVDFEKKKKELNLPGDTLKKMPEFYLTLDPMPYALDGIRSLIGMGYEVWVATKPPTGIAFAYADKVTWVLTRLPELKRRIIITHDKGLLGDEGDFLIDDRPHKANCEAFKGKLLRFGNGFGWTEVLNELRNPVMYCGHRKSYLVSSRCEEKPERLAGEPIGMYHCPDCGEMVLAGMEHPKICLECYLAMYGKEYGT